MTTHRSIFGLALAAMFMSAPALAAQAPNLALSLTAPSGTHVYESGHYTYRVANIGNKNAGGVVLTIQLPRTHTSPNVYILGTLGPRDGRCTVVGTTLSCTLGTVVKNGGFTDVAFDIAVPYSAEPIVFDASVTTTTLPGDSNLANNSSHHVQTLFGYSVSVAPPETAINRHCTGTGLASFYECELFPSSISSHTTILEPGGAVTFVGAPPDYTGLWWMPSADRLQFQYFEGPDLVAEFDGYGVDGNCFEGKTTFPGSTYMSMYEVCLQ